MIVFGNIILLLFLFLFLALVCDKIFVPALEKIARRREMSAEFAWATLMAIGSSAPELFTSIFALIKWWNSISMWAGTIVGSALFNILVIIGATAMVSKIKLSRKPVIRDLWMYIVAILLLLLTFWDGKIILREAILYVVLYIMYIVIAKNRSKRLKYQDWFVEEETEQEKRSVLEFFLEKIFVSRIPDCKAKPYIIFLISIAAIWIATHLMVDSAVLVAGAFGMSPALIWLTVLAMGTSVPDLISSVIVAKKWDWNMAVANWIGSNIFDILFWLGFPYLLYLFIYHKELIEVSNENLVGSIILLFATVIVILFVLIAKKRNLTRMSGIILIVLYVGYLVWQAIVSA